MTVADVCRTVSAVGPYFALGAGLDERADWLPLAALAEPALLRERVEVVRDALAAQAGAAVEFRVAASISFLGVASRLTAPFVAAAVRCAAVPSATPDTLYWRAVERGPLPLALACDHTVPVRDTAAAVDVLERGVLDLLVLPLLAAYADACSVSVTVLRGNVASALNGAATMLAGDSASELVARLLARPALAGTGDHRPHFVRRSCCLYYRVPGGATCADCILARRPYGFDRLATGSR